MTIVQRTTSRQNDVDPINNSFKKSWGMGGGGGGKYKVMVVQGES